MTPIVRSALDLTAGWVIRIRADQHGMDAFAPVVPRACENDLFCACMGAHCGLLEIPDASMIAGAVSGRRY